MTMKTFFFICLFASLNVCIISESSNCPSENDVIQQFNAASIKYEITGSCNDNDNESFCYMEKHHDHEGHHEEQDHDEHNSSCVSIYRMCRSIILGLNLTTEECLEEHHHQHSNETSSKSKTAEIYGYGFLMITFVSLCSLIGIFLVPLINSNSKIGRQTYEYVYAFMIAIGISALMSDAVLHLIPHAFGLHAHGHGEGGHDDHGHITSEEEESHDFIWKSCLILFGLYAFFLLEVTLHGIGDWLKKKAHAAGNKSDVDYNPHYGCANGDIHYSSEIPEIKGTNRKDSQKESLATTMMDMNGGNQHTSADDEDGENAKKKSFFLRIHPMAWLIIVGDALHNFGDGLALGASIVQSLTLGVSTMFALVFHELPHELGDYVILIKSGMNWATALILNFISSLTAIVGFFIGAAISSYSASANGWILALTAGLFIYISMTDLLPELIHGGSNAKSVWQWSLKLFLVNLGFLISFAVLLVLVIYEQDLNTLIE